jgi:hypothetical protein
MSITLESKAPTDTVVAKFVPFRPNVKLPAELVVLVTTMLVTTVVVAAGTV